MFGFSKLITFFAAAATAQQCVQQASINIGEETPLKLSFDGSTPYSYTIKKAGATYTSVHFEDLNVPTGAILTLTSLDGKESVKYVGGETRHNVFAEWISGSEAVLTYEAPSYTKQDKNVFTIDKVTFGKVPSPLESICGKDDSRPTQCYATDLAKVKSSKSVARLLIGGQFLCTGWLVGSEGHMMTNNHCIKTAEDAKNVQVEFGAVCATCDDSNNTKQLACKGTIVATSATHLISDPDNDFALVKLNVKDGVDLSKWGYLQVRPDGPKLGEEIHIIGNPRGWPQYAAIVVDDGKPGVVTNTSIESCVNDEFGYELDTQGGNSGSPIFSTKENVVVGLHNCGGCPDGPNGGIKINKVVDIAEPVSLDYSFDGSHALSYEIKNPSNTFVSVHFASINVPKDGKLTITSLDGADSVTFNGGETKSNFYADWLTAGNGGVRIDYEGGKYEKAPTEVFKIDKYMVGKQSPVQESLCGPDKSKPAPCYTTDEPTKYKSGKAVARLFIGGQYLCTGWLIGSEGHLLTNHHCIEAEADAANVQVELGAECKTCDDPNNQKQLACKGEIVATDAKFVATDVEADFTLIKLNTKANVDLTKYGFLQARPDGPKLNETIHILGHAQGWPKRFAIVGQDNKAGTVTTTSFESCQPDEFGYRLDTQGGNSGSPIISNVDNTVVGIHNCGGCPSDDNGGIKINKVVDILTKMFKLAKLISLLLVGAAAAPAPLDIGAENSLYLTSDGSKPVSQIVERAGATYISLHFSNVDLPKGAALTVTSLDGSKKVEYTGSYTNLYTEAIPADRVVLTYTSPSYEKANSTIFTVDKFVSGTGGPQQVLESICGKDNSKPAVCYSDSEKAKYQASKSVARLLIGGRFLCTGWLVGSEGHLMTNWHCIKAAEDAKNVQVEFGAECKTCDDANNEQQLKCEGAKVATDVTYIISDQKNDFALVKLILKSGVDLSNYGYLKIRGSGPVLNEEIYIPQHPNGNPKHMALVTDDGSAGKIASLDGGSCYNEIPDKDYVGHQLDTQGGSSGSPMISTKDGLVVAIHNCGGCNNGGIKMQNIISFLKSKDIPLPKNGVVDGTPSTTAPAPTTSGPTQAPTPTPAGQTVSFCSISNRVISEYYQKLYQDSSKDNSNEKFAFDKATGTIRAQSNGECLDAFWDGSAYKLHTYKCDSTNENQRWSIDNNMISHLTHKVCVSSVTSSNSITLASCNPNDIRQSWSTSCSSKNVKSYVQLRTKSGKYLSEWNTGIYADTPKSNKNELFELDTANQWIKAVSNGECLDAFLDSDGRGHLHTYACSSSNANQKWIVGNSGKKIRHATHANLCLDVDPNDRDHKAQVWQCYENSDNQAFDLGTMLRSFSIVLSSLALVSAQTPYSIGTSVPYLLTIDGGAPFSKVISDATASSLSVHIASMHLPPGATLTIGTIDNLDKVVLTGNQTNLVSDFFNKNQILVKYSAPTYHSGIVVTIDEYYAGSANNGNLESICSSNGDLAKPAACYKTSEATKYKASQAVARLTIGGSSLCTGWLVGSEGHLITNNHCISSTSAAATTQVELNAECSTCDDANNSVQLGCKGTIVASSVNLIATSYDLDFTLVKLNVKSGIDLTQFGYLQMRDSDPVLNEPVWIAGHPYGRPKQFALVVDGNVPGTIVATNLTDSCRPSEAGYRLDTLGGSSGSPVISTKDNAVLVLHNCGACTAGVASSYNGGIPVSRILAYLRANNIKIPNQSIAPVSTSAPTTAPTTALSTPVPTTMNPASNANPVQFCTISNRFVNEFYHGLYIGASSGSANEKFNYDSVTGTIQVQSNHECIDSYWDGTQFQVHTWACDASNSNQKWIVSNNQVKHKVHGVCLSTVPSQTTLIVAPCNSNDIRQWISTSCSSTKIRNLVRIQTKSGKYISEWNYGLYANTLQNNLNELFEVKETMIQAASNGQCLDVYKDGQGNPHLHTYDCSQTNANQQWTIGNGKITHATFTTLCMDFDPNDPNHAAQVWQCYPNNSNQMFTLPTF
ncbi:hypothetical protein THRCLA_20268 [Thraustotheca clavata]|uniref:Serine protease n=1 Tax=Thraustotheca clavata TaxID=74557 RepID=A0A1W0A9H8_9STRA|nr:hypothetical protein THRCLA_20268 [Thraustotheca clavata]